MSGYVIQLVQLANGAASPHEGVFVKEYVPGISLVVTRYIGDAKLYRNPSEAWAAWRADTGRKRWDGQPDRPLTAWTVELVRV